MQTHDKIQEDWDRNLDNAVQIKTCHENFTV